MNSLLNMAMNVSIAPCKICINVAFNLYKITFEYKDERKDCSAKPSLQNLHWCGFHFYEFAFKYRYECKHCSEKTLLAKFALMWLLIFTNLLLNIDMNVSIAQKNLAILLFCC